nr:hypothetical protein B0A51_14302 [Rachicladosporium sp. CCFEE 5018]
MPPRKKQRLSPTPTPAQSNPPSQTPSKGPPPDPLSDRWTDAEEIGLFKALIKYKPTGLHKHFRMLQLRKHLLDNGYIHPRAAHTKPTGIWEKLGGLYDLAALDEREDARQLSDVDATGVEGSESEAEADVYSLAENKIHNETFVLPDDDYGEAMWKRRLPDAKASREESESPAILPELNFMERAPVPFIPSFSVEASEPAATPAKTASGRGRGRPRGRGRGAAASAAPGTTRRSKRQASSEAAEDEEEVEGSTNAEEEEESSEGEEASAESTPAPRTGQRGRGRGRGARGGGRGRGRGRGK